MLGPVAAVVARNGAVAGGKLHLVVPGGRTFHDKPVSDIRTDVSAHPHQFAHLKVREVGGDFVTHADDTVRADVGHSVRGIGCSAVSTGSVAVPPPQDAFQKADAIEAEGVGGRGVDHCRAFRFLVVGIVGSVAFLIRRVHRSAEAPHDIQRFVVLCAVDELCGKFLIRHHWNSPL